MTDGSFVPVGRVVKTHGLKGEVSVAFAAEAPFALLEGIEVWFVPPPGSVRSATVTGVRPGPKGPLLSLSGITSIQQATALCGATVLARHDDLPGEWFERVDEEEPVEGYTVFDAEHGDLGELTETIITGANDVWVVDGPFGEVLIPVIEDVVLEIDDENRRIEVRLLPGLMPGEGEEA